MVIILNVKQFTTLAQKCAGLIGKNYPQAVMFQTRWGIHTFGVKFPIDVLILDKANRVVANKKFLKPNRLWWWNPEYNTVIELPENTIEKLNIQKKDTIKIKKV